MTETFSLWKFTKIEAFYSPSETATIGSSSTITIVTAVPENFQRINEKMAKISQQNPFVQQVSMHIRSEKMPHKLHIFRA